MQHAFGLRPRRVIRVTSFVAAVCIVLYLHSNPLLTLERLERDDQLQPTPDMWWLKVEPVNVSPENQVEKTEEDLIKDFKSGDVKEEKELSMKDIEQSPEAATARKIDGVCSKGEYEMDHDDLETELIHFLDSYKTIRNKFNKTNILVRNIAHQFAIWYIARQLRPKFILEVGPWQNFGTTILHEAWPSAQTILVDKGKRRPVTYVDWDKNALLEMTYDSAHTDFANVDWSKKINPRKTLVYFYDGVDHQERVKAAKAAGFRHLIFNHNTDKYGQGYFSMKLACDVLLKDTTVPLAKMKYPDAKTHKPRAITKKDIDGIMALWSDVDVYYQFPSLWPQDKSNLRNIIPTIDELLPTPKEKQPYNNICYVKLKNVG